MDAIIHGGDVFYRSRVPPRLVEMAFDPLKKAADAGIPVFIVPGNHERSIIPHSEFSIHANLHVFTRPRTYRLESKGRTLAISGFPFIRDNIRKRFKTVLARTGWDRQAADSRLLCLHQSIEGATVGPSGYGFRRGAEVIRGRDIPGPIAAVLAGHIHRFQILDRGIDGNPLAAPVFYPGAIDRVSFAERAETKGYLMMTIPPPSGDGPTLLEWQFHTLPSRPMVVLDLRPALLGRPEFAVSLRKHLERLPADAIVKLKIHGRVASGQMALLRAEPLRQLVPPTMNVNVVFVEDGPP